jgi:hypothetical protein
MSELLVSVRFGVAVELPEGMEPDTEEAEEYAREYALADVYNGYADCLACEVVA